VNGRAIYRARLDKGWTLQEVADECAKRGCPVNAHTLSRLEKGKTAQPRPRMIRVLLDILGLTIKDLIPDEKAA
jgi:transcriptional regulator with XRE-family HTH domain